MHFNSLALATLALVPSFIEAHGDVPGAPRVFGRRSALSGARRARNVASSYQPVVPEVHEKRQASTNTEGQCGQGFGSCADGYCCSEAGWCGQGSDYCAAPGCQFNFGPACDDNTIPSGSSTSTVARTKLGNVLYGGAGIYDCTVAGTIAITYDDGPYIYTEHILDVLKQYSAKATFFITGNNNGKGEIDNAAYPWAATIKRAYAEGHQIASHTWTHPHLSNITSAQRKQNMYSNEMALRNILGFFPTYMRPPYSDCTAESGCQQDMADLGYHVTYFDVDTDDYNNDSPALIQNAKNNFDAGIAGGKPATDDYLVIGHDIHNQTANVLTAYMLDKILALGYKAVTVGECLGDPEENWYRKSSGSVFTSSTSAVTSATKTSATIAPTATSNDGTCGGGSGFMCTGSEFGDCCSQAGWCGSGTLYCGEGCQAGFGQCGINVPQSSSTTSTAPATTATGVSTDATCGGSSGITCQGSVFGNCCSPAGWCGSTAAYCGDGCQSGFGSCGDSGAAAGAVQATNNAAVSSTLATSATSKAVTTTTAATATKTSTAAKATATNKSRVSTWVNSWLSKLRSGSH
ncbi:glycoside hydrolase/deacetylase [Aureobasidium pullulans]|nr:glycoside hydrolase/deacetylase [Aureobasidium pullulans]